MPLSEAQKTQLAAIHGARRKNLASTATRKDRDGRVILAPHRTVRELKSSFGNLARLVKAGKLVKAAGGGYYKDDVDRQKPGLAQWRARRKRKCPKCGGRLRKTGYRRSGERRFRYEACDACSLRRCVPLPLPNGQVPKLPTATSKLPIEQREGWTVGEVATLLKMSADGVRRRLKTAGVGRTRPTVQRDHKRHNCFLITPDELRKIEALPGRGHVPITRPIVFRGVRYLTITSMSILTLLKRTALRLLFIDDDAPPENGCLRARRVPNPEADHHAHKKIWGAREEDVLALLRAAGTSPISATEPPAPISAAAKRHTAAAVPRPRRPRGRPSGRADATRERRSAIRQDLATGKLSTSQIAAKHHVSDGYVRNVRSGAF